MGLIDTLNDYLNPKGWWKDQYGIDSQNEFNTRLGGAFSWLPANSPARSVALVLAYTLGPSPEFAQAVSWAARNLAADPTGVSGADVVATTQQALAPGIGVTMAQLIIPNCFQVTIKGVSGGQDVVNVIGVQNAAGTSAGAAAAVQTAWKVASGPLAWLSSLYALSSFTAIDIGSANGAIAVISDTTAGSVTSSNGLATVGAAALIKWNGGTRSKSSRGRLYYGPLMETNINSDGRTMDATALSRANASFSNFRTSLASSGYPLVVLSRKLSQAFAVTSSSCETTIATQRRRIRS